jgi:hypothetical protein
VLCCGVVIVAVFNTKTRTPQEEGSARKYKGLCFKQIYFNMNDENGIAMEYYNLRTNAV